MEACEKICVCKVMDAQPKFHPTIIYVSAHIESDREWFSLQLVAFARPCCVSRWKCQFESGSVCWWQLPSTSQASTFSHKGRAAGVLDFVNMLWFAEKILSSRAVARNRRGHQVAQGLNFPHLCTTSHSPHLIISFFKQPSLYSGSPTQTFKSVGKSDYPLCISVILNCILSVFFNCICICIFICILFYL